VVRYNVAELENNKTARLPKTDGSPAPAHRLIGRCRLSALENYNHSDGSEPEPDHRLSDFRCLATTGGEGEQGMCIVELGSWVGMITDEVARRHVPVAGKLVA